MRGPVRGHRNYTGDCSRATRRSVKEKECSTQAPQAVQDRSSEFLPKPLFLFTKLEISNKRIVKELLCEIMSFLSVTENT